VLRAQDVRAKSGGTMKYLTHSISVTTVKDECGHDAVQLVVQDHVGGTQATVLLSHACAWELSQELSDACKA